jgi:hypothetical protein
MEEIIQRALRQAPQWVWRVLAICALCGFALKYLCDLLRPVIDRSLAGIVDPSSFGVATFTFVSLFIIGPIWFAKYCLDPHRHRVREALDQIEVVEAAMERVSLNERERATVRRGIIRALADAAKHDIILGSRHSEVDLFATANQEVPGLIDEGSRIGPNWSQNRPS